MTTQPEPQPKNRTVGNNKFLPNVMANPWECVSNLVPESTNTIIHYYKIGCTSIKWISKQGDCIWTCRKRCTFGMPLNYMGVAVQSAIILSTYEEHTHEPVGWKRRGWWWSISEGVLASSQMLPTKRNTNQRAIEYRAIFNLQMLTTN